MTTEQTPRGASPEDDSRAPKRPWHTPRLEQTEYPETEVGAGAYNPGDAGTYAS